MLEDLLIPRHPDDDCHYSQKELLRHAPNIVERNRLAQLLRWGNATGSSKIVWRWFRPGA